MEISDKEKSYLIKIGFVLLVVWAVYFAVRIFSEIKKDVPAVFLFSPDFLYATAPQVKNITLKDIAFQNERFLSIDKWYIETDKVWKIFATNIEK